MNRVPVPAALIGALGLLPFLYGVAIILSLGGPWPTFGLVPAGPSGGVLLLERVGMAVLGFMGGCLWGFAAGPGRRPAAIFLVAATMPALLAVAAVRPEPAVSCLWLAFGFLVLQGIDILFQRLGIAPAWWLTLRLPLTAGVMTCLLVGAIHG